MTIDELWALLERHEGEKFHQIRGKAFTYSLEPGGLRPSTTDWLIPRAHVAEALEQVPLGNTVPLQHLYGPSYLYAVLMDDRIREGRW